MTAYTLHACDNASNMCGSSDRLFQEVTDIPICFVCGYKTDLYFVNPSFCLKRRVYDLSSTYDGYYVASLKFKEACQRLQLKGFEFIALPSDPEFFVIKPTSLTPFDFVARKTRFESFCVECGFHKAVAGATPAFLLKEPESDLLATDVVFGSGNSRSRMLIVTESAKMLLIAEKLTGLEFEAITYNLFKPTPKNGVA
ncbi:hypothetical protein [Shewanella putrefaciens]|uniref:hypothetical protein n=1 Tax=Shewanella putrefaciens TaxID=24 RepID=UPI002855E31C|nr:hypothetical protein [Shewanella putrefaciens]MDR6962259.1 hypothetical protein [Shewanella putrefaciens]